MQDRYYNALVELAHALHLACSTMYPGRPEEVACAEAVRFELEVMRDYKPLEEDQKAAVVDALALLRRDKANMLPVFQEYYNQYYTQRDERQQAHRPLYDKTRLMLELAPRCYPQWQGLQLGDSAGSGVQRHSQGDMYPLVHMQQGDQDYLMYAGKRVPLHKQLQGMLVAATEEERVQYVLAHTKDTACALKALEKQLALHPLYITEDDTGGVWLTDGYRRTPANSEQMRMLSTCTISERLFVMRMLGAPYENS